MLHACIEHRGDGNEYRLIQVFWTKFAYFSEHGGLLVSFSIVLQHLMNNYDRSVRPSRNSGEPLNITFGLALTQIIDVVG